MRHLIRITHHVPRIRVPVLNVKGLTLRTREAILRERKRAAFASLADFFRRVQPLPEEMESLIRVGAFDIFNQPRTAQYWEFKSLCGTATAPNPKFKVQGSKFKVQSSVPPPLCEIADAPIRIPQFKVQISKFKVQDSPFPLTHHAS